MKMTEQTRKILVSNSFRIAIFGHLSKTVNVKKKNIPQKSDIL